MIIGAALLVPWQRMEQLTDQLNRTAAEAIADGVLRHHVATATTRPSAATARARAQVGSSVDGVDSPSRRGCIGLDTSPHRP